MLADQHVDHAIAAEQRAQRTAARVSWPTQDNAAPDVRFLGVSRIRGAVMGSPHYRLGEIYRDHVFVMDDDLPPVVSVADAPPVTEGGALAFPVTLSDPFDGRITVDYTLAGTAVAGDDYAGSASGAVTFAPGETHKTISLMTSDDDAAGPPETVEVALTAPPAHLATLGAAEAAGRILDDEGPVTVTVSAVSDRTVEGADAAFELTRSGVVTQALNVSLRVTDPAGVLASTAPTGAIFEAGATTATLRLATRDVAAVSPDATVTVTLADGGAAWGPAAPSTASVTVLDDDRVPEVSVADPGEVTEGGTLAFPVTLSRPFNRGIDVVLTVAPGPGRDFIFVRDDQVVNSAPTLYFEPGTTRQLVWILAVPDGVDEPDEPVELGIVSVSPGLVGRSAATGRILDSDRPVVTVAAVANAVTEGDPAAFEFTRRGGDLSQELEVPIAVTDSGAALAGTAPTAVTFAAGDAVATLSLATNDDTVDGADAVLSVAMLPGAAYALATPDRTTVTVQDDELPVVTVAAETDAVMEGADATFALTRTEGDLSQELEVSVAVTDSGAALAGAAPTGVTFAAGAAEATLRLRTRDDALGEPDAPVTLTLRAGADYVPGDPSTASVTVRDDDEAPEVSVADAAPVTEGGTLAFPVTLNAPFNARIAVDYRFGGGTATAGDDYGAAASGTVTFAPKQTVQTIRLATTDDAADEPEETVEVTLSLPVPDPGLATIARATATGTIRDSEGIPEVTVAPVASVVAEGADAAFVLTRANGDASARLTVAVAVEDPGMALADAPPTGVTFEGRGDHGSGFPGYAGRRRRGSRRGRDADAAAGCGLRPRRAVPGFRDGAGRRPSDGHGCGDHGRGHGRGGIDVRPCAAWRPVAGTDRHGRVQGRAGRARRDADCDVRGRRFHCASGRPAVTGRRRRHRIFAGAAAGCGVRPRGAVPGFRDSARRRCDAERVDCRCGCGDGGRHARISGNAERAVPCGDCGGLAPRRRRHGDGGGTSMPTSSPAA